MCSTLDCPHYERLNCLFVNIIKIVGIPQGVDQGVHTIHREFKILNFSNEDDSSNHEAQEKGLQFLKCKCPHLEMDLYLQHLVLIHQGLGHANCLVSKVN